MCAISRRSLITFIYPKFHGAPLSLCPISLHFNRLHDIHKRQTCAKFGENWFIRSTALVRTRKQDSQTRWHKPYILYLGLKIEYHCPQQVYQNFSPATATHVQTLFFCVHAGYHKCTKEECAALAALIYRVRFEDSKQELQQIP